MSNNKTVLVVEDDAQIRNYIIFSLKSEDYRCLSASDAQSALTAAVSEPLDLILLDLGLPDADGIEVIKKIRTWSQMPIIVVSARDQDKEKANSLDAGADDYITKPFSAVELLARVRVSLRHYSMANIPKGQSTRQIKDLKIDFEKRLVYLSDKELHLTPMEYSLLSLFFKNSGKVLTTNFIIKEVWGAGYGEDTQALRALMAGLRRKIEENPAMPKYINTEIGVGYRLIDE